jgi:DMSO/TMAO reductase YedYZ molybdopterin-dependent catalytic subunit
MSFLNYNVRYMKLAILLAFAALGTAQDPGGKLTVKGDLSNPLSLTKADLAKMPRVSVTVKNGANEEVYQGVLLYDVLKRAGAPLDKELSGKALSSYVLAEAHDGYQVIFTLTELDPAFTSNQIIVADTVNGQPLSQTQGPLRIVVPNEKKAARSIRMLEQISIVRLRK